MMRQTHEKDDFVSSFLLYNMAFSCIAFSFGCFPSAACHVSPPPKKKNDAGAPAAAA
jgi:hypothetical protein